MARYSDKGRGRPAISTTRRAGIVPAMLCALFVLGISVDVSGAEFRSRIQIRTPQATPPGTLAVTEFKPVSRAMVEEGLRKIFAAYGSNPTKLAPMLASTFQDKSRLLDALDFNLPRDARLRLDALEAVSTLRQHVEPARGGKPAVLVSDVNATARSQFVYNDPVLGFRRLAGRADYLLRVRQPMVGK